MNIGIVTFHRACNYGAMLQAFALRTVLRKRGHESFFVEHTFGRPPAGARCLFGRTPGDMLRRWAILRRSLAFAKFQRRHLGLSREGAVTTQSLAADAYVCGSDQVWNPNYLRQPKDENMFFLSFGPARARRIAYAASLGVRELPVEWQARVAAHLQRFSHIGVREEDAVGLLAPLAGGRRVEWVPDPTLLLGAEDYRRLLGIRTAGCRGIFSYTLDKTVSTLVVRTRNRIAQGLAAPLVESYARDPWEILVRGVPTPCQWLNALAASRFVVTNSFHGMVFAVIFQRPFVVLPVGEANGGMNSRITSLLGRLGLRERFVTDFDPAVIDTLCRKTIDWGQTLLAVREFAAEGEAFLSRALNDAVSAGTLSEGKADHE
jgi:hypothetical protein